MRYAGCRHRALSSVRPRSHFDPNNSGTDKHQRKRARNDDRGLAQLPILPWFEKPQSRAHLIYIGTLLVAISKRSEQSGVVARDGAVVRLGTREQRRLELLRLVGRSAVGMGGEKFIDRGNGVGALGGRECALLFSALLGCGLLPAALLCCTLQRLLLRFLSALFFLGACEQRRLQLSRIVGRSAVGIGAF